MSLIIFTLALFALSNCINRKTIVPSSSMVNNGTYFQSLHYEYAMTHLEQSYIVTIRQLTSISMAPAFDVVSYSILSTGDEVDSPRFDVSIGDVVYYHVFFNNNDLTSAYGCTKVTLFDAWNITCLLRLYFTESDSLNYYRYLTYEFTLNYENGETKGKVVEAGNSNNCFCDIEYLTELDINTQLRTGNNCNSSLENGMKVDYNDFICLNWKSTDRRIANSYFKTLSLAITYMSSNGQLIEMDVLRMSKEVKLIEHKNPFIQTPVIVMGAISFKQLVEVNNVNGRRLDEVSTKAQPRLLASRKVFIISYPIINADSADFEDSWSVRSFDMTIGVMLIILMLLFA